MDSNSINVALAPYGASLDAAGFIQRNGKRLAVKAVTQDGRLRFESKDGALLASGRPSAEFVEHFVQRFWYWTKA